MAKKVNDEKRARTILRHELAIAICLVVAIVSLWRGIWGLSDNYLFRENEVLSYFASIVIGLVILGYAHYRIRQVHLI